MTDPPGRALSPTDPRDAAARRAWMSAYEAAGGQVVNATRGPQLGAPIMLCRSQWVELRYNHCDGSPVSGARYVIEADGFSATGVLDDDGFTRVEGLPNGISQVDFRFEEDPEEYVPRPPAAPTDTPVSRGAVEQAFSDALDWLWGTIQGDFNQDATISQSAVNAVIGLIPIADQVLDARDLIAGMKHLVEYYMEDEERQRAHRDSLGLSYETWLWLGLFLTAIGCIPEVGSAVKGVLKTIIRRLQDVSHAAGGLSAQQFRHIWESVVAVLNHLGIRQGNAHRWLRELPGQLSGYMDTAARSIRSAADIFRRFLDDTAEAVRRVRIIAPEWAQRTLDNIERARRAVSRVLDRLERQKQLLNEWIREKLERVIGSRGTSGGTGSVGTHPASGSTHASDGGDGPSGGGESPPGGSGGSGPPGRSGGDGPPGGNGGDGPPGGGGGDGPQRPDGNRVDQRSEPVPELVQPGVVEAISEVPDDLFRPLRCTECAEAMVERLRARGIHGQVLNIRADGGADYIVNDLLGGSSPITQNGFHQAVRVGDVVYDNFFKRGVPYQQYVNALQARFGVTITPEAF